ncbi:MAG TPA: hypothetical protein VFG07_03410 [Thermoplasmata archaeon]|nr:hypothetical protein [Thermoplasmata archaeon]
MAAPDPAILERLARLERLIADLRQRLDAVEKTLGSRSSHPVDQSAVREKVTFDWQA